MQQWYQCPNCGAPVAFGARFCGNCGTQLNWPTQQQQRYHGDGQQMPQARKANPLLVGFVALMAILLLVIGGVFVFDRLSQGTPSQTPPAQTLPKSILLINNELITLEAGELKAGELKAGAPRKPNNRVLYFELQAGDRISVLARMEQPSAVYCNLGARAPLTMPNGVHEANDGTLGGFWPYGFNATNPIQLDYIALADGTYFVALSNHSENAQTVIVNVTKYPKASSPSQ